MEESQADVLEVRRALDVLAVELACDRMRQEELTELGKACTEFKGSDQDTGLA